MPSAHTQTFATPDGPLAVDAERAPDRRTASRMQFVADAWPSLAAAAWDGFRRHGAGAVVLWRDAAPSRWRVHPFEPERLWYAVQLHTLPGVDAAAAFDGWAARQVEAYDPRREAVVVFVEGGTLVPLRVRGALAPPEAQARAAARMN